MYKNELQLIHGFIYSLAICLIFLSIWKYLIQIQEYFVLVMNILSALIFILLVEWSKRSKSHSFGVGVGLSSFILAIYLWAFGVDFNFFTMDTLIFIAIDISLKVGDRLSDKLSKLNEIVARIESQGENRTT